MAFDLAKAVIDSAITRITADIDARRAERAGLMARRDELQAEISELQARKDDLQAARAVLDASGA